MALFSEFPTVPILLTIRSPVAIFWAVGSIIVPPLKCKFWWCRRTWSHVFQKSCKAFSPPLANCDATRSVVFERAILKVIAAPIHGLPYSIFGSSSFPVLPLTRTTHFPAKASAAFYSFRVQGIPSCFDKITAFTPAKPSYFFPNLWNFFKGGQSAIMQSGPINLFRHPKGG
jgi:hypothetical protein